MRGDPTPNGTTQRAFLLGSWLGLWPPGIRPRRSGQITHWAIIAPSTRDPLGALARELGLAARCSSASWTRPCEWDSATYFHHEGSPELEEGRGEAQHGASWPCHQQGPNADILYPPWASGRCYSPPPPASHAASQKRPPRVETRKTGPAQSISKAERGLPIVERLGSIAPGLRRAP